MNNATLSIPAHKRRDLKAAKQPKPVDLPKHPLALLSHRNVHVRVVFKNSARVAEGRAHSFVSNMLRLDDARVTLGDLVEEYAEFYCEGQGISSVAVLSGEVA